MNFLSEAQIPSISTTRFRRATAPAAFIAAIWLETFRVLGYQPPGLVALPVGLILLGLVFWSMPPELIWGGRAARRGLWDSRPKTFAVVWWHTVRRHRLHSLSFVVIAAWAFAGSTLLHRGIAEANYLIGLGLLATIFLMPLIWAIWRESSAPQTSN